MNFKNSDFLMLLVAFLVGYFFQEIMNGGDIIEGNNKCTCTGGIAATTSCPRDNLEYCVSCTDDSKPREDTTKKNNKKLNINDSEYYCTHKQPTAHEPPTAHEHTHTRTHTHTNKCRCDGGTPHTGQCPHNDLEFCASCDDGKEPKPDKNRMSVDSDIGDEERYCTKPLSKCEHCRRLRIHHGACRHCFTYEHDPENNGH